MPDDDLSAFREFIEQSLNLDPLFADQDKEAASFIVSSQILPDAEWVALAVTDHHWGRATRPRTDTKRYVPGAFLAWIPNHIFYGVPALVFLLILLFHSL